MHLLEIRRPASHLRHLVRTFAQRTVISDEVICQTYPPCLDPVLNFEFARPIEVFLPDGKTAVSPRAVAVGPFSSAPAILSFPKCVNTFAVFLTPGALPAIFGTPTSEILNTFLPIGELYGGLLADIWDELAEVDFAGRVDIMEKRIARVSSRGRPPDLSHRIADYMMAVRGVVRIDALAQRVGSSVRQFERRFEHAIGLAPKAYARLARFQYALDEKLANPETTWIEVAHALSYYDQMHMIRDFKKITGFAPHALLARVGDSRPPSLLAPTLSNVTVALKQDRR